MLWIKTDFLQSALCLKQTEKLSNSKTEETKGSVSVLELREIFRFI